MDICGRGGQRAGRYKLQKGGRHRTFEITKYQISISSTVRVKELISENEISFNIVKNGDYSVASQYSQTLANEKKLIEVLTDDVTENILNAIVLKLDDL